MNASSSHIITIKSTIYSRLALLWQEGQPTAMRAVEPTPLTLSHVVLVALLGLSTLAAKKGLYRVEDGHVGVCYFGGRLQNTLQAPGYSMHLPLLTSCLSVPVQMQTRRVTHIACGTSGGTVVEFESIEVVYRLRRAAVVDTIRNYQKTIQKAPKINKVMDYPVIIV